MTERTAWARFLLSMRYRNRECVEFLKMHMTDLWREATAALEEDWAARRKPDEYRTLAEATAERQPGAAEKSTAHILADIRYACLGELADDRQLQRMKAFRLTRAARPQTEALFALPDQAVKIIRNTFPQP